MLVLIDAMITAASLILGYVIKFYVLLNGPGIGVLPLRDYVYLLVFIIPGYVVLYYAAGVYTPSVPCAGGSRSSISSRQIPWEWLRWSLSFSWF